MTREYAPLHEFNKLKKRMAIMTGYNMKVNGYKTQIDDLNIEVRMLRNEIRTTHQMIANLKKKVMSYSKFQDKEQKRKALLAQRSKR